MKYSCGIIDDLLPLYLDGACSEESKTALEAHLQSCKACRVKMDRMKAEPVFSENLIPEREITDYARKVRRHRIRQMVGAVALCIFAACLLALLFLTFCDMYHYANPIIFDVEEGVWNLTSNHLEISAGSVGEYIFFTNNTKIEVTVEKSADYSGEILLWNADDRNNPYTILYGKVTPDQNSCTFSGLSSAHRYMVTCDGKEDLMVTVTDGRHVTFFGSMKNVLEELLNILLDL